MSMTWAELGYCYAATLAVGTLAGLLGGLLLPMIRRRR